MTSCFDLLCEVIHSGTVESWKDRNQKALEAFLTSRYGQRAEKAIALRAPEMPP